MPEEMRIVGELVGINLDPTASKSNNTAQS